MRTTRVRMVGLLIGAALVCGAGACSRESAPPASAKASSPAAPTNRVDIPAPVRQNLGITFAKVERRAVEKTIRVPGRVELLPGAQREYRALMPGQVELLVGQFEPVQAGQVMARVNSAAWREMQARIAEAEAAVRLAEADAEAMVPLREAHRAHQASLAASVEVWERRVAQLEELVEAGGVAGSQLAEARATLATTRGELADVMEQEAELEARQRRGRAELDSAHARLDLLFASAAAITGLTAEELRGSAENGGPPRWRTIDRVEVRAEAAGVVESVGAPTGGWVEESDLLLSVIQPERVRFRARGLQSDLAGFRDGLAARAVPAARAVDGEGMSGRLVVGLAADPDSRTVDLLMTPERPAAWARPGVAGFLEITLEGGKAELAIPLAAVARDGVRPILFRRDPKNPDKAIRMDADLGVDDGRWVVVKSGLREGDEVVLNGAYQLALATSGSAPKGGHFHADGTFHEGEDH